jgi:drug/metabolite transporter (DMT)-like permease
MVTFFASLAALTYGFSDFSGGLASRKSPTITVVAWSQGIGLLVALVFIPFLGKTEVQMSDLLWGIGAGLAGASGVGVLYRGLATGLASVVSPVAALTGAALPIFFGLLTGERPDILTWAGVALALPAILLLSSESGEKRKYVLKSLETGFLAGCGFSGFFILIAQTGENSGMWPLVAARTATVPIILMLTALRRKSLVPKKGSMAFTLIAGAMDMGANIFYLMATRTGFMVTAVVITALYPAPTVLFQRLFLKEELSKPRIIGLILAIGGGALIGIGS